MQTLAHHSDLRSPLSPPVHPLRIVALGDSLIYGFGDPEEGGWVERLRRSWMRPESSGHILYNLGIRGDGVRQVAQRLDSEYRNRGELRHRVPDLIILSVGVNDSCRAGRHQGRFMLDFEAFQTEIANLLDHARQLCPVLFVGMTPVDESKMPFAGCLYYSHADQHRYKEAIRLACTDRQIPYLDLLENWLAEEETVWRSRLCDDGLHPNSAGYAAILQDFLAWEAAANLFRPALESLATG